MFHFDLSLGGDLVLSSDFENYHRTLMGRGGGPKTFSGAEIILSPDLIFTVLLKKHFTTDLEIELKN